MYDYSKRIYDVLATSTLTSVELGAKVRPCLSAPRLVICWEPSLQNAEDVGKKLMVRSLGSWF